MDIRCTSIVWLALLVLDVPCGAIAQDKKLPLVGSGIIVGKEDAVKWNRVILLATPRIASGDTSKLSETVRTAVSKLTLTILATVESEVVGDGTEAYRLSEVGVGYSTIIKENRVTITSETAGRMGAGLDFYGRQMLSENEEQIGNLKVIFRTSTLTVFDAPAIMLRDGQHKDFLTRHLIWVDPKTGKLDMAVWLLSSDANGRTSVAEKSLRVVAPGTNEDRKIHVDGRSFFLGIPSKRAFALEELPPGIDFEWTDDAKALASLSVYKNSELIEFVRALQRLLHSR